MVNLGPKSLYNTLFLHAYGRFVTSQAIRSIILFLCAVFVRALVGWEIHRDGLLANASSIHDSEDIYMAFIYYNGDWLARSTLKACSYQSF